MNDHASKLPWITRKASAMCVAAVLLLPLLYFGSYGLLLDQGTVYPDLIDPNVIFPPEPKPCIREEYIVGGEGAKLFFRPANFLHRVIDRLWSEWSAH